MSLDFKDRQGNEVEYSDSDDDEEDDDEEANGNGDEFDDEEAGSDEYESEGPRGNIIIPVIR